VVVEITSPAFCNRQELGKWRKNSKAGRCRESAAFTERHEQSNF